MKDYNLISFTDNLYNNAVMRDKDYNKVLVPLYFVAAYQADLKDSLDKFYEQVEINLDLIREQKKKYIYLFLSTITIAEEVESIIMFTTIQNNVIMKVSAKMGVTASDEPLEFIKFKV